MPLNKEETLAAVNALLGTPGAATPAGPVWGAYQVLSVLRSFCAEGFVIIGLPNGGVTVQFPPPLPAPAPAHAAVPDLAPENR